MPESQSQTAEDAALQLGRELSDESRLSTAFFEVHEDELEEGHVSLRVDVKVISDRLMTALGERGFDLIYLGPKEDNDTRAVYAIRTNRSVHEGVY